VQRWYVSFHGGEGKHAWNNIHVFDLDGRAIGKALDSASLPKRLTLRELRGFAFGPDGDLYVANAFKNASQILRFSGELDGAGRHSFREVYIERHAANPGLAHPFDVVFGPDRNLYIPSQDTNVVGRYFGPTANDGAAGKPMPHPEAIVAADSKHPLPGTFVPSHEQAAGGLRAVRRAIFGPGGDLYVADRDSDRVKRYAGESGTLLREYQHRHLRAPVHLLFRPTDGALLAGSRDRDALFAIDVERGDVAPFVAPGAGGLKAPGGMAFGPDGKLYICSRESRQILRFDSGSGEPDPAPFIAALGDFPEFIALVDS
jgi:DNA-binding beta-propeller fold protein YncE